MRSLTVLLWAFYASRGRAQAQEQCQITTRIIGHVTQLSYSFAIGNYSAENAATVEASKPGVHHTVSGTDTSLSPVATGDAAQSCTGISTGLITVSKVLSGSNTDSVAPSGSLMNTLTGTYSHFQVASACLRNF